MADTGRWICCQLGARQHYVVPRALHKANLLSALITDLWVPPDTLAGRIGPKRIQDRYHLDLADARVIALNAASMSLEARQLFRNRARWDVMIRRNEWFQDRVLKELQHLAKPEAQSDTYLFSFSYAARRLFKFAKSRGWTTVLEQIDPGPREEEIVARIHEQNPDLGGEWRPAPAEYWRNLREEWTLADRIIVNSTWSQRALLEKEVPAEKIRVVPLAFDAPPAARRFARTYPDRFTAARPLRVLFLGLVNIRKGVSAVLDAMDLLKDQPVEFWFVGPLQMSVPAQYLTAPHARWVGSVPRAQVEQYYQTADLFLFPTFSDGFGLTQLEAQAWKLPITASPFCGDVVRDGVNGIILPQVTGQAIAEAVRSLIAVPRRLSEMSRHAVSDEFGIEQLIGRLESVATIPHAAA
jgi:glycosyltransferase involved in cell wall biosynthesis